MIILSNESQGRWKDSVAAAPSIDLCLLANGEEKTQVITSKGAIVLAGILAPTAAPTITDGGAGNLTNNQYAGYAYVYAATSKYPTVSSLQGAGGDLSIRSNTSPNTVYQFAGVGNRQVNVKVTKTDRQDIDRIWIYRTLLFSTSLEASTAATAGQLFYIGEVTNDGVIGTISYADNSLVFQEQIESDNLVAPTAQYAAYYDPYFFLFGQNEIEVEVDVSISGLITILNSYDGNWYDGRDGQFVKLQNIDVGGFDNYGQFYFQYLTPTTAQLTLDQAGTQLASAPYIGRTKAKIYGYSTTLYRSKPNNPFAWGETIAIGTAVVARSWTMKVGGGNGVAMTVIPASSLLKLDLHNPTRSYIFNLKQTQTEAFKSTRRLISDTYTPANNFCQFSGLDNNRQLQTYAIDSKNFCIIQTDGSNVIPISDPVKDTVRDIIKQSTEHVHFHGFYDPNSELNCFFFRQEDGLPTLHKMVYKHAPSDQWGTLDCFDILCSSIVQDKFTGKTIILGGSASGFVGQLLCETQSNNWIVQEPRFSLGKITEVSDIEQIVDITPPVASEELDGRYFVLVGTFEGLAQYVVFYYRKSGSTLARPDLILPVIIGRNFDIVYVPIDYTLTDTQAIIAQTIGDSISFTCSSGGTTNFPLRTEEVSGIVVSIRWKRPVLYFIPLTQYYDYNSGTTFSLNTNGGSTILYEATLWDNTLPDKEKLIGNWAILEKTLYSNLTGIVWGRIKDIELTAEANVFRLYFDLLYVPATESFIFELTNFMFNDVETGFLLLSEGLDFVVLMDEVSRIIITYTAAYGNVTIGATEVLLRKHLDLSEASENKSIQEIWLAVKNTNEYEPYDPLLLGYLDQTSSDPDLYSILNRDKSVDGTTGKDNWFINQGIEFEPFKTFGFSIVQRGPSQIKFSNITLKM